MRLLKLPNALLIAALVAQVLAFPLLDQVWGGRAFLVVFEWLILVLALRAARAKTQQSRIGYLFLLPAVILHVAAALSTLPGLYPASLLAQAAFHGFVVFSLLRYVLSDDIMTLDELFAAASMYILLAFAFAYVYALIEFVHPGAFYVNPANNPDGLVGWWELLYFSFTCLTSVGFGEITPVADTARSVVMLQQMAGVLYVAILISRLTQMQALRRRGRDS